MTAQATLLRTAYVEAKVYINVELEVNGDGSQEAPFSNFNNGKDYAELDGTIAAGKTFEEASKELLYSKIAVGTLT